MDMGLGVVEDSLMRGYGQGSNFYFGGGFRDDSLLLNRTG